jgi:cobalt/nickel transport system permease protein
MIGVHLLIGIGEALITVGALSFVLRTRPALLEPGKESARGSWAITGLMIALVVTLLAPFASGHPDGLEWVAETRGFLDTAQDAPFAILPDYTIPGLDGGLSTILAGIVGVVIVAAITLLAARVLRRS